jgi:hypothetical protein
MKLEAGIWRRQILNVRYRTVGDHNSGGDRAHCSLYRQDQTDSAVFKNLIRDA